jgi:tRNA (Thr-GGU) A37 N-methylase
MADAPAGRAAAKEKMYMKETRIELKAIGTVESGGEESVDGACIRLEPGYGAGLTGFEGFSHALVVWYAHKLPSWDDAYLMVDKPYRMAPDKLGIFATRSPFRPNSVCVSVMGIRSIDKDTGMIRGDWIDAEPGSLVVDIKPYHPSSDRLENPEVPAWCSHWPRSIEGSGDFPWGDEFLF